MTRAVALLLFSVGSLFAVACSDSGDGGQDDATSTVTASDEATGEPEAPPTDTPSTEPNATALPPEPTETPVPAEATVPPVTNRRDCNDIRGTDYLSGEERDWFLDNCTAPPTQVPAPQQPPAEQAPVQSTNCDPSYPSVCLPIGAADYDCAGGSGNGPNYIAGPITVLPPDPHGLDRDGDGVGCE